jgi:hypothetical protein
MENRGSFFDHLFDATREAKEMNGKSQRTAVLSRLFAGECSR